MVSLPLSWLLSLCFLLWLVRRGWQYYRTLRRIRNWPGYRGLGPGGTILRVFAPGLMKRGLEEGHIWNAKHDDCERFGWDVISNVSWYFPKPRFHIADPDIIQQIGGARATFPKPWAIYSFLDAFGPNVVTTEKADWVRHRKIASPAFNEGMLQLAWEQTKRVVYDMMDSEWSELGEHVLVDDFTQYMKELAMLVLMGAAFGHVEDWTPQPSPPPGHQVSLRVALQTFLQYFAIHGMMPKWVWGSEQTRMDFKVGGIAGRGWLGSVLKNAAFSHAELGRYLREMVDERQFVGNLGPQRERRDLFSSLMLAMGDNGEKAKMTIDEIFGNLFIFLLAGHETTAHSLTNTIGLLALYQKEQEKVFKQIQDVLGDRDLSFDDQGKLTRVLAVFYEAMRLFPPVTSIPKTCTEDTLVKVKTALSPNQVTDHSRIAAQEQTKDLVIPKGSDVMLNVAAVNYNPRYWRDPQNFEPDRFLEPNWPKDHFVVFSVGARGCLGRKFSETEAVAAITLILRRFRVIPDPARFHEIPGELDADRRERLLKAEPRITLTPVHVPLLFIRR